MRKWLAVLAVVLYITQTPVPTSGQTPNKTTHNSYPQNNNTENSKNIELPSTFTNTGNEGSSAQKRNSQKNAQNTDQPTINVSESASVPKGWLWYEKVAWGFNIILSIAACIGIYFAWGTVKANEKSAKAALLNAQALIASERAWIIVTFGHFNGKKNACAVTAKNRGRTPARVACYSKYNVKIVTSEFDLPPHPQYENILKDPMILMNEESNVFSVFDETAIREACGNGKVWSDILKGIKRVYIVGIIYYQDILDTENPVIHETAWCCEYRPGWEDNSFMFGSLSHYNKHT